MLRELRQRNRQETNALGNIEHAELWLDRIVDEIDMLTDTEFSGRSGIIVASATYGGRQIMRIGKEMARTALFGWVFLTTAAAAGTTPLYTVIGLGKIGSKAFAINDKGEVVGWEPVVGTSNIQAAILLPGFRSNDLGTFGGDSEAFAINDAGQVVGDSHGHVFLDSGGPLILKQANPPPVSAGRWQAHGIVRRRASVPPVRRVLSSCRRSSPPQGRRESGRPYPDIGCRPLSIVPASATPPRRPAAAVARGCS